MHTISQRGNIIEFTLWDEMAEHFEHADLEKMGQPVIIALSLCRVSKYRDYQLAATPATYYYLNPNIPEAEESRTKPYTRKNPATTLTNFAIRFLKTGTPPPSHAATARPAKNQEKADITKEKSTKRPLFQQPSTIPKKQKGD
ncbi:nucleic acid-binding, OB-fold protein [Tanacetum coccineum]